MFMLFPVIFVGMSLFIASLNSGSNGNCYYVGNDTEAVLIDAGISCKETEKRMLALGLSMEKVKAIFVSHEHTDHISGIAVLSKKYALPVYITPATLRNSKLIINDALIFSFTANEPTIIGSLFIYAFPKFHDADDPHSFLVNGNGVNVGIFTDIGVVCKQLVHHFKQCDAAILESNYDVAMLENGGYPYHLKKRITGGRGHLSNAEALQLFIKHSAVGMSHLLLGHLSKNNNCPILVKNLFAPHAGNTNVVVASRHEASKVYEIHAVIRPVIITIPTYLKPKQLQLSLF